MAAVGVASAEAENTLERDSLVAVMQALVTRPTMRRAATGGTRRLRRKGWESLDP
jgi:hypothetical protein